jgi:hypothetical protein
MTEKEQLREFNVTFMQRYRREEHPKTVNGVTPHPDGWFTVKARDWDTAKRIADRAFGPEHYAGIYDAETFFGAYYPKGQLGTLS